MQIEELIERYNQALQQGMTSDEFAESVGMQRKSIQQKARRKGYIFDKENNRYIKQSDDITSHDPVEHKPKVEKKEKVQSSTNKSDIRMFYSELEKLSKRIEALEQANTSQGSQGLILREFGDEPLKQISYRWNSEVLELLEKVCEMYPHYTKTAILNSLLLDGLERVLTQE